MTQGYFRDRPDVSWWLTQIREGTEWRNRVTLRGQWGQWRKWYRGDYPPNVLPINLFFKMLRTMVPRVYLRNPGVSIAPRKHQQGRIDFWVMSRLLEQVDNALFDRMRVKKGVKMAIQDTFLYGTGFTKLGYGGQYTPTPDLIEDTEAPTGKKGERVEYHAYILPNTPWFLRVPPERVIYPKNSLNFESARWVAHQERRHIDDVRSDERYSNAKNLNPGVVPIPGEPSVNVGKDMIDIYEIRDKKLNKVFAISATNVPDKVLHFEDDELSWGNRHNFFPLVFNVDDEYCWGLADSRILAPHQTEVNQVRRSIRKHRRISVIKFIVEQGLMDPDQASKLVAEDEVGALIVLAQGKNLSGLKEMQAGDIPQGLLKDLEIENQMVQEILGMGVNQFGEYAPGSSDRSATEAQIVNQAVQIRTDERRDAVADLLTDATEHLNHIIGKKWSDSKQLVSIIGPEGQQVWVEFMQSELDALDYDIKIDPDSAVPETRQTRKQEALENNQIFGQNQQVDQGKMTRHLLQERLGPAGVDFMVNPSGAPAAPGLAPGGGGPGATPSQPANVPQVIQSIMDRRQKGPQRA